MRRTLFLAVLALAFALGGCGKDKVVAPARILPPIVPIPSPYTVMDALKIAYERRDTTEIKALYDNVYQGSSLDQTDHSPMIVIFPGSTKWSTSPRWRMTPPFSAFR
ncbi:MAG TPA: hypothetical protein VEU09_09265 [Candidatus Binatia bacterium]|nr:hypothetical protein [Candidatus Binatia bacterium]